MSELKDSGTRREFTTGAVRDVADGKGRCDLLPLVQVSEVIDSCTLLQIAMLMASGEITHLKNAIHDF